MQKYLFSFLLLLLVIPGITAIALQTFDGVEYTYDLHGNRIKREYKQVLMKRGLANDSTEVEAALGVDNKITVAPNPTTGILKLEITG